VLINQVKQAASRWLFTYTIAYTGVYENYVHLATGLVFAYIYSFKIL